MGVGVVLKRKQHWHFPARGLQNSCVRTPPLDVECRTFSGVNDSESRDELVADGGFTMSKRPYVSIADAVQATRLGRATWLGSRFVFIDGQGLEPRDRAELGCYSSQLSESL